MGGAIGGLIGIATGKRNQMLALRYRRGDFDFTVPFPLPVRKDAAS